MITDEERLAEWCLHFTTNPTDPVPIGFDPHMCTVTTLPPVDDVPYSMLVRILMSLIFTSLSILGIVGNILVIIVVLKAKGMKTPTNCYLVSLAASDALFFVATAPTELSYLHTTGNDYPFGSLGCALFTYLPYLAINSSSLSITAFTIERYIGICHPLRARSVCTVKRAKVIIFLIWIFSLVYNSPWLYLASVIHDDQGSYCSFKLNRDNWSYKVMFLGDFFAFYVIPMILNCVIYGRIAVTISLSQETLKRSVKPKKTDKKGDAIISDVEVCDTNISNNRRSTKGRYQVVKMLAVVVIVFAICWLPYRTMVMYNSFASRKWDPDWYILFSKTLIFMNCAVNPVLYNLMSAGFRNAFRSVITGSCTGKNTNRGIPIGRSTERSLIVSYKGPETSRQTSPAYSPL